MEQQIRNSFCNYCNNKRENCMQIETYKKNNVLVYKCINYQKKDIISKNDDFNYIIKSDTK